MNEHTENNENSQKRYKNELIKRNRQQSSENLILKISIPEFNRKTGQDIADASAVQLLDIFTTHFTDIYFLNHFKNLKTLRMLTCSLADFSYVKECPHLQELYLDDNVISNLEPLNGLNQLKRFSANFNRVEKVAHFRCPSLEQVSLNHNKIKYFDSLTNLKNLKELYLAKNRIEVIPELIPGLKHLHRLNLAGNHIGHFKEILALHKLGALKKLRFHDPMQGDNPICSLNNYSTFVMYNLTHLEEFDCLLISDEAKNVAEATFMKKKMYYNMRIKTIQRNASYIAKALRKGHNIKSCVLINYLNYYIKMMKDCEYLEFEQSQDLWFNSIFTRQDCTEQHPTRNILMDFTNPGDFETLIESKKALIQQKICHQYTLLDEEQSMMTGLLQACQQESDFCKWKMVTELQTGGNIRLEEGKPGDKHQQLVEELLKNRFDDAEFQRQGVCGSRVMKVVKVSNKFQRIKMDKFSEKFLEETELKRNFEHLFQCQEPDNKNELKYIIEHGFRDNKAKEVNGQTNYISLSKYLSNVEIPYIRDFIQKKRNGSPDVTVKSPKEKQLNLALNCLPVGSMLVCRVITHNNSRDNDHPLQDLSKSAATNLKNHPIKNNVYSSVFRTRENDFHNKVWYISNNSLVCPEYQVEFEQLVNDWQLDLLKNPDLLNNIDNTTVTSQPNENLGITNDTTNENSREISRNTSDHKLIEHKSLRKQAINLTTEAQDKADLMKYLEHINSTTVSNCNGEVNCSIIKNDVDSYSQSQNDIDNDFIISKQQLQLYLSHCNLNKLLSDFETDGEVMRIRTMYFNLHQKVLHSVIDQDLLLKFFNVQSLELIKKLNLHEAKLKFMPVCFNKLHNLSELILSFNCISIIENIEACEQLEVLDLSFNQLQSIDTIPKFPKLTTLHINNNLICKSEELEILAINCPKINFISINHNPLADQKNYLQILHSNFNYISRVDNLYYSKQDRESLKYQQNEINPDLILKQLAYSAQKNGQDTSFENVTHLNLSHLKIKQISNLTDLTNLKSLILSDNEIHSIDGLNCLVCLEELSLEENFLTKISNLTHLTRLKSLDLSKNKIAKIDGLLHLKHLNQLSLDDNKIKSLGGIHNLENLMELYLTNNRIHEMKEINQLKELQRLIILDFTGNSICRQDNYRSFVVFKLRKLKVLDSLSVEATEQNSAKEIYSGRITDELLESKLNGKKLQEVRELDLSNCNLKDQDDMFNEKLFMNLKNLKLSNNFVVSLRGFGYLPRLVKLDVSQNKIDKILIDNQEECQSKGILGLVGLEDLNLAHNLLVDANGFQLTRFKQLRRLKLSDNRITKLDFFGNLDNLQELDVSRNRVKFIEQGCFENCINLKILKLDDNLLKQVQGLEPLESLEKLYMAGNKVNEVQDIEKLRHNENLQELVIINNPICRRSMLRTSLVKKIPKLKVIDGKEVTPDEREGEMLTTESQNTLFCLNSMGVPKQLGKAGAVKTQSINFQNKDKSGTVNGINSIIMKSPSEKHNGTIHNTISVANQTHQSNKDSDKGSSNTTNPAQTKKSATAKMSNRTIKSPSPKISIRK